MDSILYLLFKFQEKIVTSIFTKFEDGYSVTHTFMKIVVFIWLKGFSGKNKLLIKNKLNTQ